MDVQNLYLSKNVRALDQLAVEELSVSGYALMTRAGQAALTYLKESWPSCKTLAVVCGRGNNAGDGYVVARLAHEAGYRVQVLSLIDFDCLQGDALLAARAAADAGVVLLNCEQGLPDNCLEDCDVLVDAILGIGLDRPLEGCWLEAINRLNDGGCPILALDIPSGLNADTGTVLGAAVKATRTISFIALKRGLFTGQGREYCGRVHLADLNVPEGIVRRVDVAGRLVRFQGIVSKILKPREPCAHKGHHGHVLLVGGDAGMAGALALAGEAALRSGAGLVSLATRRQHAALLSMARPELMSHGVERRCALQPLLRRASVVAVGPGLGTSNWGRELFAALLENDLPMIVDADALNLLANEKAYRDNWVLTPHPGEAARMLDIEIAEVEADRFSAVRAIQMTYGGTVVLKGAGSLICYAEQGGIDVCGDGNPGMAVGGMGDVLTGILAGLLGQKIPFHHAVTLGVCLHSSAADLAAQQGQRGLLPSDLFPCLRSLINV